ncbi:pantoate--beta-alanine ligase [Hanamia caeni]|uniref:Pantothenate synthetase n=1 Tax=Hanamia caeni TaxID=2294116 RepID=A0A3M9NDF2_9BACT|nr:pantoate--beta-alanine ligase [Hanamia caeni]RNI35337.1 pantoate--beta-alanine ligase [Hanamia caeni]
MIIFKRITNIQKWLQTARSGKAAVGFVPTMGALHEGHLSLLQQSKKQADISIVSIFINPAQFDNKADLEKYPSTVAKDIKLLEENGCDILFLPSESEIYPDEKSKRKHYDLGNLETVLEGKFRPGHFQGVCLVVERLLTIITPDVLFLGRKDFQQCLVIKRLISLMKYETDVIICPIAREQSGLAMSSRNQRLNEDEREIAAELFKALKEIKENRDHSQFSILKKNAIKKLELKGFKIDYLELAKEKDLQTVSELIPGQKLVILIAAFLQNVRLIDNIILSEY